MANSLGVRATSTPLTLRDACGNAFGRILENTIPPTVTKRLYAYSIYDPDTGLYKIGARWYDPVIGVWLTPDSIVPDVNNPMAWNPYAFNYQNPVQYVDPSGHIPIWDILDVGFFFSSLASFAAAPGLGTGFDLFLDTLDLLPGVTGLGWGDEAVDAARLLDDTPKLLSAGTPPPVSRAWILKELREGTAYSRQIADAIDEGKIGINILGEELFAYKYLKVNPNMQFVPSSLRGFRPLGSNQIYLRAAKLSPYEIPVKVVHEAVHVFDVRKGALVLNRETLAFFREAQFALSRGLPSEAVKYLREGGLPLLESRIKGAYFDDWFKPIWNP